MNDLSTVLPIFPTREERVDIEKCIREAWTDRFLMSPGTANKDFLKVSYIHKELDLGLEDVAAFCANPVEVLQANRALFVVLPKILGTTPERLYGHDGIWIILHRRFTGVPIAPRSTPKKARVEPTVKPEIKVIARPVVKVDPKPEKKQLSAGAVRTVVKRALRSPPQKRQAAGSNGASTTPPSEKKLAGSLPLRSTQTTENGTDERAKGIPPAVAFATEEEAVAKGFKNQRDRFFFTADDICEHKEPVGRMWFRCTAEISQGSYCVEHGKNVTDAEKTREVNRKMLGSDRGYRIRTLDG